MDSHFPLNVKIKLESYFSLICTFENKSFLIKLTNVDSIYNMIDNNSNISSNNSLSLRQSCLTSVLWHLLTWSQRKKLVIKTIHSINVNPRTFWAKRSLAIATDVKVLGFVSRWKHGEKFCIAGQFRIFSRKSEWSFLCVCVCIK